VCRIASVRDVFGLPGVGGEKVCREFDKQHLVVL